MSQMEQRITGRQIAAARALVGVSQADLASQARISTMTLKRMEGSEGEAPGMANNVAAVRAALEAAGVIFEGDGEMIPGGRGVRMKSSAGEAVEAPEGE